MLGLESLKQPTATATASIMHVLLSPVLTAFMSCPLSILFTEYHLSAATTRQPQAHLAVQRAPEIVEVASTAQAVVAALMGRA